MAIERKFVSQNLKEFRIKEFVSSELSRVGLSSIKLQRTPLGDKIIISASRPGLVVGRAGSNIQKLTAALKEEFNLENPQIEIEEVAKIGLDANIIAEMIVNSLERFGSQRFKGVGHRALHDIMDAGALGAEILISGKIPSQRARTWRFYQGYLKKCGDVAITGVDVAYKTAVLKSGAVGVKVSLMPPTTILPDRILVMEPDEPTVEEVKGKDAEKIAEKVAEAAPDVKEEAKKPKKKAAPKKESKDTPKTPKKEVKEEKKEAPKEKPAEKEEKKAEEKKPEAPKESKK
ncbi:30S ribosomal protein S3 [Candidatus Woesearchaeota archaeon]|nr:30S ribosomal protein S3 [Candidatus Woesearchaeota archaeon]